MQMSYYNIMLISLINFSWQLKEGQDLYFPFLLPWFFRDVFNVPVVFLVCLNFGCYCFNHSLRKFSCLFPILRSDFLWMSSSLSLYSFFLYPGSALSISQPVIQSRGSKSFSHVKFLKMVHSDLFPLNLQNLLSLWNYIVQNHPSVLH